MTDQSLVAAVSVHKPTLTALELAALQVAARPLAEVRSSLLPGPYSLDFAVRLSGGLTVRESVSASTPGDLAGLAAWCLARLPRRHQRRLAAELARGRLEVTDEQRQLAKAMVAATRGQTVRAGAIIGALTVREVE